MRTVFARDFDLLPADDRGFTKRLNALLDDLRSEPGVTLRFEPGTYHFYPDGAPVETLCIPNHHLDGERSIVFHLGDMVDFTLDGGGAEFLFHGELLPFYCARTRGLRLRRFTVDFPRPVLSQGRVLKSAPGRLTMEIDPAAYPWQIEGETLLFTGEGYCLPPDRMLEFDTVTRAPAQKALDFWLAPEEARNVQGLRAAALTARTVELTAEEGGAWGNVTEGNTMILWHHLRTHPGVYVPDSADFFCEDATFYHAAGIAILAERTENVSLSRVRVLCRPGSGRLFSAMADAAHFVACYGSIRIEACAFENQMDDAVNIHGIYGIVRERTAQNGIEMELHHDMQLGAYIGRVGDTVSLLRADTMLPYWSGTLAGITRLSPERFSLTFDAPLPQALRLGDVVEDVTAKPDAHIKSCAFCNNRGLRAVAAVLFRAHAPFVWGVYDGRTCIPTKKTVSAAKAPRRARDADLRVRPARGGRRAHRHRGAEHFIEHTLGHRICAR